MKNVVFKEHTTGGGVKGRKGPKWLRMEGSIVYAAGMLIISGALEVEANWWLSRGSLVVSGGLICESCNGCNEVPGKLKGCKFIPFLIVNICKDDQT